MSVVVVGASAAGFATAEGLRRNGYDGALTLVGAEPELPYDRPPLSKQVLTGQWDADRIRLCGQDKADDLGLDLRLGTPAAALDVAARRLSLADGTELPYEQLVLATGVGPRPLPGTEGLRGVRMLRSLEDALALRAELRPGTRLVVIGAGFLGTEIAAAARTLEAEVWLVEPEPVPLGVAVGAEVGEFVAGLHRERGVHLRTGPGAAVRDFKANAGEVEAVVLEDGTELPCDLVVVAIGSVPSTGWLAGSGLTLGDGIECDSRCSAAPGVYAAGDVASWFHEHAGVRVRLEHRTNATEQGLYVARALLGQAGEPFTPVPYFWSDQYETKLTAFGLLRGADEIRVVEGAIADGAFVALYRKGNRLTGVLGVRRAKSVRQWRALLAAGSGWDEAFADSPK
ncbi:NAD(P)/FAD-dependent oxidoreductase [Amycolatopsis sp. YIM 10]|uniref:NAD(P)/FAD-dependent oxidoreductase n=1 Tax=Amycolatopsis sp. YIM 10 TaxID=2653857 RepID=UPI00128FE753|nr:FAD/NAD(P)-binding oxidoreductase [Amycolatopsis sp. YIM 10]QFU93269.1 Rhodocoxin reductase [Amycolatopsis sp. YIM 10]